MGDIKNKDLRLKIGATIKDLRKKKGLLQTDVFNDTGIHIARIEAAGRNLTISSLAAITDYFEISLADFFKLVEKQK